MISLLPRHPRNSACFSYIEGLLIAIWLCAAASLIFPSLKNQQEIARKQQCKKNLYVMMMGCLQYAEDHQGTLPESMGTMSFDLRKLYEWDPVNDRFRSIRIEQNHLPRGGLGHLTHGYLEKDLWSSTFHCPSHQSMGSKHPGHGMDVGPGTNRWGLGVSWMDNPNYLDQRIIMSYQYRGSSYETQNKKSLSIKNGIPQQVIIFDSLQTTFGIQFGHQNGYGTIFLDGSYHWFEDEYGGWVDTELDGLMNSGIRRSTEEEDFYQKWERLMTYRQGNTLGGSP